MEHFGLEHGLSDTYIRGLFEDRDGVIWIGTAVGGLHYYANGRLSRSFGPADGVATGILASFAQDREGRVWVGSNANGLSVYKDGRFRRLSDDENPPSRSIASLLVDSRGDLWIGTASHGLFRRREGRYEPFGVAQGLGHALIALMIEDREGTLWVSTGHGISRLTRDRIDEVAAGRRASLDPIVLDRRDGLLNVEGSGGGFDPSGLRDRDGRLWFSTIDGIAVIDPATFRFNTIAPRVMIETVALAGRAVAPDETAPSACRQAPRPSICHIRHPASSHHSNCGSVFVCAASMTTGGRWAAGGPRTIRGCRRATTPSRCWPRMRMASRVRRRPCA